MENASKPSLPVIALTAADVPRLVDHYMRLSPGDLRLRFFGGSPTVQERRREWLTDLVKGMFKRATTQQLGIVDPTDGEALVGVASWGPCNERPEIVDFGVSVVPTWRGRGLTLALMDQACFNAVQAGHTTMRVEYMPDNDAVKSLLHKTGQVLSMSWSLGEATASLNPYTDDVQHQLELLATFLEALDLGNQPAKL